MKRTAIVTGIAAVALGALLAPRAIGRTSDPETAPDTAALSQAIAFFEGRLREDPGNTLAASRLADRYVLRFQRDARLDDLRRAEEVVASTLGTTPDLVGAHVRLSSIRLARHDFAGAYDAAMAALAVDSTDADARGAHFDAALALGRYDEAERVLASLRSDGPAARVRTAAWLSMLGEDSAAYHRLERVCEELVESGRPAQLGAWCWTELANIELSRSGVRAATRLLHRALALEPGYRGAVERLADFAHARGDWREALRLYESIATDAHPDLYLRLAEVHTSLGNGAAAERRVRDFLRVARAPDAEPLFAKPLALFYAAQRATQDSALAIALRDVARRPTVESWDVLARVRFLRGELDLALAASDSARRWGSPSPTMNANRGSILRALGRREEAERLLAAALREPARLEPHMRTTTPRLEDVRFVSQ